MGSEESAKYGGHHRLIADWARVKQDRVTSKMCTLHLGFIAYNMVVSNYEFGTCVQRTPSKNRFVISKVSTNALEKKYHARSISKCRFH